MTKKKLLVLAMALSMVAILMVGGTLAYFTSEDMGTNTFTTGNVEIDLFETKITDDNGNILYDGDGNILPSVTPTKYVGKDTNEAFTQDYGTIYPGMEIKKDPTIDVKSSEETFVAAIVKVTSEGDLSKVIGMNGCPDLLDVTKVLSGGVISTGLTAIDTWEGNPVFGTDDYTVYQQNVDGTWYFYFLKTAPMTSADADVVLFDTISIPADWDNEEMAEFKDLEIVVEAYGAQAYGFTNCLEAMQANWATDFPM